MAINANAVTLFALVLISLQPLGTTSPPVRCNARASPLLTLKWVSQGSHQEGEGSLVPTTMGNDLFFVCGGHDPYLKVISAATGRTRWTYSPRYAYPIIRSYAVWRDEVYVTLDQDTVPVLDRKTGREKWTITGTTLGVKDETIYDVATDRQTIYLAAEGGIYAVRRSSRKMSWKVKPKNASSFNSIVLHRGRLIVKDIAHGLVLALDLKDGRELWRARVSTPLKNLQLDWSPLLTANRLILCCCDDGYLFALDPYTGRHLWKAYTSRSGLMFGAPAVGAGRVYVFYERPIESAESGWGKEMSICALDLRTGRVLWKRSTRGIPCYNEVCFSSNVLYANVRGIWALDARTGRRLWRYRTRRRNGAFGPPEVHGNRLYVGYTVSQPNGRVHRNYLLAFRIKQMPSPILSKEKQLVRDAVTRLSANEAMHSPPR